ncbi:hypothetical protein GGR28_002416 [Lewinella aquimaris]|uniref:Uncharacterized protein n=1 Tax=Neolewinella aquimaris TaxID=1835722 RepID=A0A840EDA8_9BACT|nr:hypothetical protein [Neolewinella aquimaris]MBB4079789.1 hypothetical protein [Neolewinella aquimaris]
MHLSPAACEEFTHLNERLLAFAGRQSVYGNPELIERFLASEAGDGLSEKQRRKVRNFSTVKQGKFFLVKQYKKYAVLMDDYTLYGVVGTCKSPEAAVEAELPVLVEAVLRPFDDRIVVQELTVAEANGNLPSRSDIEYEFKQIKDVRGITETLDPRMLEKQASPATQRAEKQLRQYLKSAATRDKHQDDTKKILDKHPELYDVYMQMYSKLSARAIKKELKANGVRERHFAVYNNSVVAVAATRSELLEQLSDLSFDGMMDQCALFRL